MSLLASEAQSLSPSGLVSLFVLDTSSLGGPQLRFVVGRDGASPVSFGGVEFQPIDIEFDGLETTGTGALPTPQIRISNIDGMAQAIINTWGDLLNCTLYRLRTHVRFLDGQADPDGGSYYGPDIFRIERKTSENSVYIEWELSAAIDQEGKQIPGRTVIRDTCLWHYRRYDAAKGTFDYSKAKCPYSGDGLFDINDLPVTDPARDMPSRRLGCCRARFGRANPLPFGGFPGVQRVSS